MPQIWINNKVVVEWEELVPEFYSSLGVLKVEISRYKNKENYGIKKAQSGGNGRKLLIYFDSLPKHIQEALGDPRKTDHPLELYYKRDAAAVDFYLDFQRPDGSYLHADAQERYITNASVIQALLQLKTAREMERIKMGGSIRGINKTLLFDSISFKEVLKTKYKVVHNLPSHPRRFNEAIDDFTKRKYISLIKDAEGTGKQNRRIVTDEVVKFLNDLFATQSHKPTATEVAGQYEGFLAGYVEVINNTTGEVYDPKGFKKLSTGTITKYLAQWQNKIGTHSKRSGDRQKLMQKFKPAHSLEQPKLAGSLISIDDRQPPFEYKKGERVWFYNAIDLASGAFVCWVYGKSKEGIILDFYRQLVRNYHEWGLNLPDGLECESSLNSSFKDSFLQEGSMFQNVRIEANNARGKRIEAYYKPLRYKLEKKREGWLARPFALSESNQIGSDKKMILPYEQIINGCLNDIVTWNNMPHNQEKEISCWEYFLNNQNPDLKPTNYKAFLPHLGYKTQTSCNAGIINLQYGEYLLGDNGKIFLGDNLIRLMKEVEGRQIDIYWLDDNQGKVFKALIYRNGRYICEARPKPTYNRAKIEQTDDDRNAREIMSSYVATIEAYQRQQLRGIDKVTVIDNRPLMISNTFTIPGINRPTRPDHEGTEVLGNINNEDYDIPIERTPSKRAMIDRF